MYSCENNLWPMKACGSGRCVNGSCQCELGWEAKAFIVDDGIPPQCDSHVATLRALWMIYFGSSMARLFFYCLRTALGFLLPGRGEKVRIGRVLFYLLDVSVHALAGIYHFVGDYQIFENITITFICWMSICTSLAGVFLSVRRYMYHIQKKEESVVPVRNWWNPGWHTEQSLLYRIVGLYTLHLVPFLAIWIGIHPALAIRFFYVSSSAYFAYFCLQAQRVMRLVRKEYTQLLETMDEDVVGKSHGEQIRRRAKRGVRKTVALEKSAVQFTLFVIVVNLFIALFPFLLRQLQYTFLLLAVTLNVLYILTIFLSMRKYVGRLRHRKNVAPDTVTSTRVVVQTDVDKATSSS